MKIPIQISPFFWLTAGLIGWINSTGSQSPVILTLIWVFVIFISILIHEYGHALTALHFGQRPRIQLVAFGGITYPEGTPLRGWREFFVVLNGPLFGFLLFLVTLFLLSTGWFQNSYILDALKIFTSVNLFWTIVNLLPVMPLDGGQLLRVTFESLWGTKGVKYAIFVGMLLATCFAIFFFSIGYFLVGAIFFLFAFQNFDTYRHSRYLTESDRNTAITTFFKEAEMLLTSGSKEAATLKLEEIREKTKKGLIFNLTTHYLAKLKAEEKDYASVYQLLLPIKKNLNAEGFIYLHRAAYEEKDYLLVMKLAGPTFQFLPDPEVALMNAEACAVLKLVEATLGWLKAAKEGGLSLTEILKKEVFDFLRTEEAFKQL